MQSYGQSPGQSPGQSSRFINMMILQAKKSGDMPELQDILMKPGKPGEIMLISPLLRRSLLQKMAEPRASLTPNQLRTLIQQRLYAFLVARLLGRQFCQHSQMKIRIDVLRHLITMGIPRIRISLIALPKPPKIPFWQLSGSLIFHPSGDVNKDGVWSESFASIEAITTHPSQHLIALTGSDGNVWMRKTNDPGCLFTLFHDPESKSQRAITCAFNFLERIIAVAVEGYIIIYGIYPSLQPKLLQRIRFHEDTGGYSTCPTQFSASDLQWHPSKNVLTAISDRGVSRSFFLEPMTFKVRGEARYGHLFSVFKEFQPICACFSQNGKIACTGYSDGTIMLRADIDTGDNLSLNCLKITENILPGHSVKKVVPHSCDHSVFAIETTSSRGNYVHILKSAPDGSITITATIPNARSPYFHKNLLIVLSANRILFHRMNSDNIPVLVTEFQSQGTVGSFLLTTVNGEIILYYSHMCGGPKLHMAALEGSN